MELENVVVYGVDKKDFLCPFCEKAKSLLQEKEIDFTFLEVKHSKENIDSLLKRLNKDSLKGMTVPQIFIGEDHIGGFTELKSHLEDLELDDMDIDI